MAEIVRRSNSLLQEVNSFFGRFSKARNYSEKVADAILAKAFAGSLVSQDPTDESASALLERIKQTTAESQNGNGKPKAKSVKRGRKGKEKLENVANSAKSVESTV